MASWAQKHRPEVFEQVLGQDVARDVLSDLITQSASTSVMLVGPAGVGKSTLARIYARALLCGMPTTTGSSCGACPSCRAFTDGEPPPGFFQLPPSQHHMAAVRGLVAESARDSWGAPAQNVLLVDDADDLRGWRLLKEALDADRTERVFIFTVDHLERIPPAIIDRLRVLELHPPPVPAIYQAIERVCVSEGVTFDADALRVIAAGARNFRQAIGEVQILAREGAITKSGVLRKFYYSRFSWIESYLAGLAAKDVAAQVRALRSSTLVPAVTVAALLEAIVWLKTGIGRGDGSSDFGTGGPLPEARRLRALGQFGDAARSLAIPLPALWDALATYWARLPSANSQAALEVMVVQFWEYLREQTARASAGGELGTPEGASVQLAPAVAPRRARRARSSGAEHAAETRPEYLSKEQASALYEAATFALQIYWAPFNCQLEIVWSDDVVLAPGGVGRAIDRFAQALQRQVEAWGCDEVSGRFSRLLLNERDPDGRMVTTIVGHVPGRHRDLLQAWLVRKRLMGHLSAVHLPMHGLDISESVGLHWRLMRELWRGLDPEVRVAGRYPLVDLLGVPPDRRRPVGPGFTRHGYSASQNIGEGAQKRLADLGVPHMSALADNAWSWIANGWERHQFQTWRKSGVDRGAEIDTQNRRFSSTHRALSGLNSKKDQKYQFDKLSLGSPPWGEAIEGAVNFEAKMAEISSLFAEI